MWGPGNEPTRPARQRAIQRLTILELMLLVAGVAIGIWVGIEDFREDANTDPPGVRWVLSLTAVLGGISLLGPPIPGSR